MLRKKGAEQALRNAHTRSGGPEAARAQTRSPTRALPLSNPPHLAALYRTVSPTSCAHSPRPLSPRLARHSIYYCSPRGSRPLHPPLFLLSPSVSPAASLGVIMSTGSTVMPEHTIRAGSRRCRQGGTCTARGGGGGGESSPSTRQDADARFGFKVSRSPAMPMESLALHDQRHRLILAGSRHKLMTLEVWEEEPEEARAAVRQRGGGSG